MSDLEKLLIKTLIETLKHGGTEQPQPHPGPCGRCCDCTTQPTFEHTAGRFNEQAAFAAAESQKAFVQQQSAQFAQLLKLQYDTTNSPTPLKAPE